MKRLPSSRVGHGVTLIEMMIGVAVVGVLLAVAIPSLTGLMERRRVVAAAGEIANIFTFAKSEANVVGSKLSLHMEPVSSGNFSCALLVNTGSDDGCSCDNDPNAFCPPRSTRVLRQFILPADKSVTFQGSGRFGNRPYVVGFGRDNLYTGVQDLQVEIKGLKTGATLRVEYNNAGRVRTCSPDGSLSGFPACT